MTGSQWWISGAAFLVASFALNSQTHEAAWTAALVSTGAFVTAVVKWVTNDE